MAQICVEAEKSEPRRRSTATSSNRTFTRIDQSIAMAALFTAYHLKVQGDRVADRVGLDGAVDVAGTTAACPIFALTPKIDDAAAHGAVPQRARRCCSSRAHDRDEVLRAAEDLLLAQAHVQRAT